LKKFDGSAANIANLKDSLHELHTTIDVDNLYEEAKGYAEQLIEEANYNEIIRVFNHKGIVRQIGQYFEVKPSAFIKKAKYLLANESNGLIKIVREHMPQG
ncbi:MAG: hypothetical protein VX061_07200, partial [Pseudomonadota bacterium]|nr:hypothetical protein [Pseudomonadota bacterium]